MFGWKPNGHTAPRPGIEPGLSGPQRGESTVILPASPKNAAVRLVSRSKRHYRITFYSLQSALATGVSAYQVQNTPFHLQVIARSLTALPTESHQEVYAWSLSTVCVTESSSGSLSDKVFNSVEKNVQKLTTKKITKIHHIHNMY